MLNALKQCSLCVKYTPCSDAIVCKALHMHSPPLHIEPTLLPHFTPLLHPHPTSAHNGLRFLETGYQEPEALVSLCCEVSKGTESKGLQVHPAARRFDY